MKLCKIIINASEDRVDYSLLCSHTAAGNIRNDIHKIIKRLQVSMLNFFIKSHSFTLVIA